MGEAPARSGKAATHSPVSWRRRTFLLLSLPTAAVVMAVWILHVWRVPTRIEAELTTSHVEFTIGPAPSPVELLKAVPFQHLAFEKFSSVRFDADTIERAIPSLPVPGAPPPAWSPLRVTGRTVSFLPNDSRSFSRIIFESPEAGSAGTLDALRASRGTRVTLQIADQADALGVRLQGEAPRVHIALSQPTQFVAEHLRSDGVVARPDEHAQVVAYRARLREGSPLVAVEGSNDLMILLHVPKGGSADIFAEGEIPVTAIRFEDMAPTGNVVSSLIGSGQLGYPAYPRIAKRTLRAPAFLGLAGLQRFSLREIRLDPARPGVVLRMQGVVRHAMTSAGGFEQDYRLTLLEILGHSSVAMLMLAAAAWMVPTTIGACRLFRELQR